MLQAYAYEFHDLDHNLALSGQNLSITLITIVITRMIQLTINHRPVSDSINLDGLYHVYTNTIY